MANTATIESGDKVKLVVEGIHKTNGYGDSFVEDEKGNKIFYSPASHKDNVTLVSKKVAEPVPTGTVVSSQYGDKYLKVRANSWRFVRPDGASGNTYTWDQLGEMVGGHQNLHVLVKKPVTAARFARDIDNWTESFVTATGTKLRFKVDSLGQLDLVDYGYSLTADETVALARAILQARGLEA